MASTMGCIGLAAASDDVFAEWVGQAMMLAAPMAQRGGEVQLRWTDPSGARLTGQVSQGRIVSLTPSLAAPAGARLAGLVPAGVGETVVAAVIDADGEPAAELTGEIEQWAMLPAQPRVVDASVVALGIDVRVYPDTPAYEVSDDSWYDLAQRAQPRPASLPPAAPWPQRLAVPSLLPYGSFATAATAEPYLRLVATVQSSTACVNNMTGQRFHVVGTTLFGMQMMLALAASDHPQPPSLGSIVAGTAFVVINAESLWRYVPPIPTRRGRRRR